MSNVLKFMGAAGTAIPVGQQEYTAPGTYSWVCPDGVFSVSAVYIGGGGHDASYGGSGGALGYRNNLTVVPGTSYTVVVGAGGVRGASGGQSYFISTSNAAQGGGGVNTPGTYTGDGGGNGGAGKNSGSALGGSSGGAGGYSGAGGNGATASGGSGSAGAGGGGGGGGAGVGACWSSGGGGTGIYGQGSNGAAGTSTVLGGGGGSGGGTANGSDGTFSLGTGGLYGGGTSYNSTNSGAGPGGAVRIIWPGTLRQFPSTRTANE